MTMDETNYLFEDFIKNPTNMTNFVLTLAKKSQDSYNHLLYTKKFKDKIKLRLLYLNKYPEIYAFINNFKKKDLSNEIENLFNELMKIFNYIALNNILLNYSFLINKDKRNPILTKEDEKLLSLRKLYNEEISLKEFNSMFGHYALNPFELSSRRFSEYSNEEMKKIGKFLNGFEVNKKYSLKDYLKRRKRNLFAIYSTLREELKYCALLIISNIRFKLIKIQKYNKIKNIFEMDYNDIQRKGYC
jgi:hypothetical protein